MAETAEAVKASDKTPDPIVIQPFKVLRNAVEGEFVQHKITRGKAENTFYPAPVINEANVQTWYDWIGGQAVAGILQSFMKRISQGWDKQAKNNATKEFNLEEFTKAAASFSVIGETMKVLTNRLRELQLQMKDVNVAEVMAKGPSSPEALAFIQLAQRVQSVFNAIENKRRPDDNDEEEDSNAEPVSSV